jgi:hypothetical protein
MREERSRPLRVALFGHDPTARSVDFVIHRAAERLPAFGISPRVLLPSSREVKERFLGGGRGWTRQLRGALYWYLIGLPRRLVQIARASRCDVIFLHKFLFRYSSPPVLESVLKVIAGVAGRPIVYSLDDAMWARSRRSYYARRCQLADRVVTANAAIAEFARVAGAEVANIEIGVEVDRFAIKPHDDHRPVVIGYTATRAADYLAPVAGPLAEVCRATGARALVIADAPKPDLGPLNEHLDWELWDPAAEHTYAQRFDIGIMPLVDTEHHRGKIGIKIKEYMAAGLPSVASAVGHNPAMIEQGEQGYLAADDREWVEYLTKLVRDPELRARQGASARLRAEERYDFERSTLRGMVDLFDELADRRRATAAG